jgi:hypothetical protein
MCLIVDANVASLVLVAEDDPNFGFVHECLFDTKKLRAKLVYGGERLLGEYRAAHGSLLDIVEELDRRGRTKQIPGDVVEQEIAAIVALGLCRSNDHHIIALARTSVGRLVCSRDVDLHADFTNKKLIDRPRGKVYQGPEHKSLVAKLCRAALRSPDPRSAGDHQVGRRARRRGERIRRGRGTNV